MNDTVPDERTGRAPVPAESDVSGLWGPIATLRREMDRLFDDFTTTRWPGIGARLMAELPPLPAMDLVERDGAYEITAELPGTSAEDLDLRVAGDVLVLKGEKRQDSDRSEAGRHVSERRFGRFQRTLRLPPDAMPEGIAAQVRNGVLTVTIPRAPGAASASRTIKITDG